VFGRTQFDIQKSGTGSGGMVNAPYVTNLYDSLKKSRRCRVNETLADIYKEWRKKHPFDVGEGWAAEPWCQEEMPVSEEMARQAISHLEIRPQIFVFSSLKTLLMLSFGDFFLINGVSL